MATVPQYHAPDALDAALRRELDNGEFVRWHGRPLARVRVSHFAIWFFAVPWTAFALFWTGAASMATRSDTLGLWGWIFPLWGLPFVVIGLGMLSAPFAPLIMARRTLLAITERRIVELTRRRGITVKSYSARQLGVIERTERSDGSGSLRVSTGSRTDSDGDRHTVWLDFGEHPQVAAVEAHVRRLIEGLA